jgi:hypothetical protein
MDSFLVQLNSDDGERLNGEYLSHVQFNFKNVFRRDRHVERILVSVENTQIPCSFFAIHQENDTLDYLYNGTPYTIALTHGNYNGHSLAQELANRFIANSTPFATISVNSSTGRLTLSTASTAFTLYASSPINKILGIGQANLVSVGNVATCPISVNLLGITAIRISSTKLPVSGLSSKGLASTSILANIPVDNSSASFGLLSYTNMTLFTPILKLDHLSQFDIQLFDQDGVYVDFRGVGWTMTLKFDMILREEKDTRLSQSIQSLIDTLAQSQQPEQEQQQQEDEPQEQEQEQEEDDPNADQGDLNLLIENMQQQQIPPETDESDENNL